MAMSQTLSLGAEQGLVTRDLVDIGFIHIICTQSFNWVWMESRKSTDSSLHGRHHARNICKAKAVRICSKWL